VAFSKDGEILVRGKTLFQGYREDETVVRPLTPEGWFATGDVGRADANGCITIIGRKDNLFIVGGENIQPEAIERALCRVDHVAEAVVVPIADDEFGCLPVAFVRSEAGATLNADGLREYLAGELPRHAVPRHFFSWPEDAPPPSAKVKRRAFSARAEAALNKERFDRSDRSDRSD
jgi:O-succinylbenzoic acid--CoA ligase